MAIANPFKLNNSFTSTPEQKAWDNLYLNGMRIPGLIQSVDPVITIEYEILEVLNDDIVNQSLTPTNKNFINQSYVVPKSQTPKSAVFNLLIYTAKDFELFTKIAKELDKGKKFKLSHPQTDIWGLTEVYIDSITPGYPNMETGMELSISFIQAIDKPKGIIVKLDEIIITAENVEPKTSRKPKKPKQPSGGNTTAGQRGALQDDLLFPKYYTPKQ